MPKPTQSARIRDLERELEATQATAQMIAEDLMSILAPYCAGDAGSADKAIKRVAEKRVVMMSMGKAVH